MTNKERIAKALELAGQTKAVECAPGALKCVPELFKRYFPNKKAVVIADNNKNHLYFIIRTISSVRLSHQ